LKTLLATMQMTSLVFFQKEMNSLLTMLLDPCASRIPYLEDDAIQTFSELDQKAPRFTSISQNFQSAKNLPSSEGSAPEVKLDCPHLSNHLLCPQIEDSSANKMSAIPPNIGSQVAGQLIAEPKSALSREATQDLTTTNSIWPERMLQQHELMHKDMLRALNQVVNRLPPCSYWYDIPENTSGSDLYLDRCPSNPVVMPPDSLPPTVPRNLPVKSPHRS